MKTCENYSVSQPGSVEKELVSPGEKVASSSFAEEAFSQMTMSEILMDKVEILLVAKYLKDIDNYLEWGSGGSTLNFAKFAKRRVVSIEHQKPWCEEMPEKIRAKGLDKLVELRCQSNGMGNEREGTYEEFKAYVDEIKKLNEKTWDFVFIDGRARVSCARRVLSYLKDTSIVVVHDFERVLRSRDSYSPIFLYYDVLERIGTSVKQGTGLRGLAILQRKKELHFLQGNETAVDQIVLGKPLESVM